VNRAHTLIEFLHTTEDFPEKFQIGVITVGILCTQTLLQTVASQDSLLDFFMSFLDREEHQWNEVQAAHWARVATSLVGRYLPRDFFINNDHKYLRKVIKHMANPSVHEFMCFLVGVEPESERASLLPYYVVESDLILIMAEQMLLRPNNNNYQINCCATLSNIVGAFSSLPSFSTRFHARVRPTTETLLEAATARNAPPHMTQNMLQFLTELVAYDQRAAKYALLCGRGESNPEEAAPFVAVALNLMPRIAEYLQGRGWVLHKALTLVRALVSSGNDTVLQTIEAHSIIDHMMSSFFCYRCSEFARHVVMGCVRDVLRGTNYRAKMLLLESSCCLTAVPQAYRNGEKTRHLASLGHISAVLTEILTAAAADSDVGCVVDAHGEWGQVRARYPRPKQDEAEIGLDRLEMVELFGVDEAEVMVSPPRAPVRCFVSPVPERGSITPDSVTPERKQDDDICGSPGEMSPQPLSPTSPVEMDDDDEEQEFHESQQMPAELPLTPFSVNDQDSSLLRYCEPEAGDEEDANIGHMIGQMESVAVGDNEEVDADEVHVRTPMHKPRGKSLFNLDEINDNLDKENQATAEACHRMPSGTTPKKMVQMGDGYQAVSGHSDTPKPKVQARARTYYSRAAKSKSPFASAEKTPKSRIPGASSHGMTPGSAEKLKKRLF